MEILIKDQLWRCLLSKEPTKRQRKRRFLWEGFLYWLIMCRRYPRQAVMEIGAILLIFATMFGLLYFF